MEIPAKLLEVLKHEGVVAIVTSGEAGPHVVNTWNSYVTLSGEGELLIPAGGMRTTEANLANDRNVLLTAGSREVDGLNAMGTGFLIRGTARFIYEGDEVSRMKKRFLWLRALLCITPMTITQTL